MFSCVLFRYCMPPQGQDIMEHERYFLIACHPSPRTPENAQKAARSTESQSSVAMVTPAVLIVPYVRSIRLASRRLTTQPTTRRPRAWFDTNRLETPQSHHLSHLVCTSPWRFVIQPFPELLDGQPVQGIHGLHHVETPVPTRAVAMGDIDFGRSLPKG